MRFSRSRLGRDDVVALQKKNLIARERRLRQEFQEERLQPRQREGKRHEDSLAADLAKNEFQELSKRFHFRPAEFVGGGRARTVLGGGDDRGRDVADEDRLETRLAAADQGQYRQPSRHRGKAVEEVVFGAEHDGWPHDRGRGHGGQSRLFARRLATGVLRRRARVRADRRNMHEPRIYLGGGLGDARRLRLPAPTRKSAGRSREECRRD